MRVARVFTASIAASLLAVISVVAAPRGAFAADCIEEAAGRSLTCSANDVRIAQARAVNVTNDCSDADGVAEFDLVADVTPGPDRYDIGIYIAESGDARTGECVVSTLQDGANLDQDECLDITDPVTDQPAGHLTVACEDQDGNGQLDVDSCLSWDNRERDDCQGPDDAFPSTPSKCRCERVNVVNIPVDPCEGNTCDDGNACNGVETCDPTDGSCDPGTPVACGDGDACNGVETCDPADGSCDPGTPVICGDGNACNGGEVCDPVDGSCDPGTPVDCSSLDDQCNDGVCDPATGNCFKDPTEFEGDPCQDGNVCTSDDGTPGDPDQCLNGTCTGVPVNCDALDDQCNEGVCNQTTGACEKDPTEFEGVNCNDTFACTSRTTVPGDPDECRGGTCTGDPVDCDDEDNCTEDSCEEPTGCVNEPIASDPNSASGDARAYGASLVLLSQEVIAPQPDSNVDNPYELAEIPLDPVGHVDLVTGSETETINSPDSAATSAEATTADIFLLDQTAGAGPIRLWTVTAKVARASSSSEANASGASSIGECELLNVKVAGQNLGRVTEPVSIPVVVPGLGTKVTVHLCEHVRSGAAAGEAQPAADGTTSSGLIVNAIHITSEGGALEPITGPTPIDLVVSHAESNASFGTVCEELADVSGEACVAKLKVDEEIIDPENQLLGTDVGCVKLPSSGGNPPDATLAHVGPLGDGAENLLIESNTAFAHTDGTPTEGSNSHAQVEDLDLLAVGGDPAAITADLVRSECTARPDGTVTAETLIASLSIGGTDIIGEICGGSGDPTLCKPEPNTDICAKLGLTPLCDALGISIILNEQIDTSTAEKAEITVNAIHVKALDGTDIPASLDLIVASSKCDVKKAGE